MTSIRSFLSAFVCFGICIAAAQETQTQLEPGFVSLFDGRTLDGWKGAGGYSVENGNLVSIAGGRGNLLTAKEFADFNLRFEFKLTPGANNGLGIRCPMSTDGNLHIEGIELQIIDDTAEKYKTVLKSYQFHGSIYGLVPAKTGSLKPVGDWNKREVIVQGPHIKVILNGTTIVDANLDETLKNPTLDGQAHPGASRKKGHIGFLGHGDRIEVRNIRIKELAS